MTICQIFVVERLFFLIILVQAYGHRIFARKLLLTLYQNKTFEKMMKKIFVWFVTLTPKTNFLSNYKFGQVHIGYLVC